MRSDSIELNKEQQYMFQVGRTVCSMRVNPLAPKSESKSALSSAELVQTEPFCSSSEASNSNKSIGEGSLESSSRQQMRNSQMNMQTQNEIQSNEDMPSNERS